MSQKPEIQNFRFLFYSQLKIFHQIFFHSLSSQNPRPLFHKVLTLALSYVIVSLLSFSGSLFFYILSPGRLFFKLPPGCLFFKSSPGCLFFKSSPGFDPGIHKETGKELVVRWIAGTSPAMTKKIKRPAKTKEKGRQ